MNINNVISFISSHFSWLMYYLPFSIILIIIYFLYKKSNKDKLKELSEILHQYYNLFFIILFLISLSLFSGIYFTHTNNVEKRFDKALKSYEQSLSNIFNNLSIETNNYTNESIVPNTSSSCTSDRISINNNNIMNMSEGDGFDELEKSFEIGLDLLKASLSEIMKNSNDVLTFWFAFLSVIMVVFTFAGILINNNVLEQSKIQLKFVEKEAQDSIKNIEAEIQKSIDENNKYIRISQLFNLGEDSGRNKDYNSVIKYNLEIITLYGDIDNVKDKNHINNYAGALYNIGTAKYELKIYDEAIEYLNKSIELNPYLSEAYNNLGLAYYAIKEYNKSLNHFNDSLSLNNKDPKTYNNRGTCKEKLEDYKGAIEDYNEAIRLNPNYSEAYNNRGNAKNGLGNIEEAIEDYNKSIELNTNNSEAYFNRYLSKSLLLEKIVDKNSKEYKKTFDDAYNDLDTSYNLANDKLKETIKEKIIDKDKKRNEVAIKFCKEKGWI